MNGRAVLALPHSGIAGDAADRTADGHFAAVRVDRAAVYILNFRTIFHLKIGTLQPDRTGGADGTSVCAFAAGIARNRILDHAAGLYHQLGRACGAHRRHAAEVPQHRALTQCDRGGDGCVGGDDGVLHINEIIAAGSADRTITDGLSKHRALMCAAIIKDDVRQGQTGALAAGVGLHLNHGGVVPAAGIIRLLVKRTAACDGVRPVLIAGDRQ